MLTSNRGLWLAEEQEKERHAKKQKKKEIAQRQKEKAVEQLRQRVDHDPSEPFRGSLTSKSKGNLQEIVSVLGLSKNGTAKDLQTRINPHFNA